MIAQEAKNKAIWVSLPSIICKRIEQAVNDGLFSVYFYKSITPEIFKDIDTTLLKLQELGYKIDYREVSISDDNDACGITKVTKLTIKW